MVGLSLLVLALAAETIEDILLEAPSFLSKNETFLGPLGEEN